METVVAAPVSGTVSRVAVEPGAVVEAGTVIATIA
jgi:biotin carboxyl carrier protein